MKKCERCGASNAERARFCSNCAAPFATAAASQPTSEPTSEPLSEPTDRSSLVARPDSVASASLPATFVDATRSNVDGRVESADDFYRALATILTTFGRVLAFLFGRTFSFLGRCCVGLWRALEAPRSRFAAGAVRLGRDALRSFAFIFVPAARWSESAPPNFLLPSVVLFFLWRRPFALVAVVYSILSSEAQKANALADARRRAASARNWIFLEALFVAGKAFVEAFDMLLPILRKLFF